MEGDAAQMRFAVCHPCRVCGALFETKVRWGARSHKKTCSIACGIRRARRNSYARSRLRRQQDPEFRQHCADLAKRWKDAHPERTRLHNRRTTERRRAARDGGRMMREAGS